MPSKIYKKNYLQNNGASNYDTCYDSYDTCSEISDSNNFDSQLSQFSSWNFTTPTGNATTNQILNTATTPKRDFDLYWNMETHIQSLVDKLICKIAALKSHLLNDVFDLSYVTELKENNEK